VVYSDPGGGKTHFFSTLAYIVRPVLVWFFDGVGKQRPYLRMGHGRPETGATKSGIPFHLVKDKEGELLFRIEYYKDIDMEESQAMQIFLDRLAMVRDDPGRFGAYVLDSATFATLRGRKLHQYTLNPDSNDARQWYGGATDIMEEVLMLQLPAIPAHVGVAMHIEKTKVEAEGTMVRAPFVPGRLKTMTAAAYPEMYRLYSEYDERNRKQRWLQTETDDRWMAMTQLDLPDPCKPDFRHVWVPVGEE
jgi:hypothetical protein